MREIRYSSVDKMKLKKRNANMLMKAVVETALPKIAVLSVLLNRCANRTKRCSVESH